MEDTTGARDDKPFAQAKLLSEEKCPICGDSAAKHVHYGAMTCFSCRAFFRRSIQNKTADNYVCRRTGTCEINLKTRKNCQFCRFQKCMTVGMKRGSVLTEEERNHRFRKTRDKPPGEQEDKSEAMDLTDQFQGVNLNRQQPSPGSSSSVPSPPTSCNSSLAYGDNGGSGGIMPPLAVTASKLKMHKHVLVAKSPLQDHHQSVLTSVTSGGVLTANGGGYSGISSSSTQQHTRLKTVISSSPSLTSTPCLSQAGAMARLHSSASGQQHRGGVIPAVIKQEVITSAEQQQCVQQHSRLVNGQPQPPPTSRSLSFVNEVPFAGNSLESLHRGRSGGVIKHSSLNIKEEPALTSPLRGSTHNSISNIGLSPHSHQQPHTTLGGLMMPRHEEDMSLSLSPEEALRVVQTVSYDDISVLLGANELDHDLQGGSTSSGESNISSSDRCSNSRSPYDYHSRNVGLGGGASGVTGLDVSLSEWYPPAAGTPNSTFTLATAVAVSSPMPSSVASTATLDSAPPTPSTLYSSSNTDYEDFTGEDGYSNDFMAMVAAAGLQVGTSGSAVAATLPSTACYEPMSESETDYLAKLVASHNQCYKSVNFGEELIKEMIMCSLFGIAISTRAALTGYRLSVDRMTRIAKSLDAFNRLTMLDQEALLKENADLLVSLRGAIFFESRKKGIDQVLVSMGVEDMDKIKSMFSQLMQKDNANLKHINYSKFNSVQDVGDDLKESRYDFLLAKVGGMLVDEVVVVLVTMIVLFSGDFCSLQDRGTVEETQIEFILLLRKYYNTNYPRVEAMIRFANTLEIVSLIREMADIKKSRKVSESVQLVANANLEVK
jgi:hypothetical protein